MSRRNKRGGRLIANHLSQNEYRLKNYLHINNIHKDSDAMKTIIINSFYVQSGGDNDAGWKSKLQFANQNFGRFCQYAQNNWK